MEASIHHIYLLYQFKANISFLKLSFQTSSQMRRYSTIKNPQNIYPNVFLLILHATSSIIRDYTENRDEKLKHREHKLKNQPKSSPQVIYFKFKKFNGEIKKKNCQGLTSNAPKANYLHVLLYKSAVHPNLIQKSWQKRKIPNFNIKKVPKSHQKLSNFPQIHRKVTVELKRVPGYCFGKKIRHAGTGTARE